MILTVTVSEIFGGQTNSSILVVAFSTINHRRRDSSSISCVGCAACARLRRALDAGKYSTCYFLVTPEHSAVPRVTGAASAQQEIHWCAEVSSKMGILSVATSSSRRTDTA